jgi:hypothetical protein
MGGLMSTFFGVFRALVYFYQRNHVVQHACDEVYLLQKDHNRKKKMSDGKKTTCCGERSNGGEKQASGELTLDALEKQEKLKKEAHQDNFEKLKDKVNKDETDISAEINEIVKEIKKNRQCFHEVDVSKRFLFYKFFNLFEPCVRKLKLRSEAWIREKRKN